MNASLKTVAAGAAFAVVVALLEAQPAPTARAIAVSPAFAARHLTAHPTSSWITNGGNVYNQRYSPLTSIDRDNVADLKRVWRTRLSGSGAAPQVLGRSAADRLRRRRSTSSRAPTTCSRSTSTRARSSGRTRRTSIRTSPSCCCGWSSRGVGDRRRQDLRRPARRAGSSRSISAPARSCGRSKPSAGRTASASRARRSTTTAWSSRVSRAARSASRGRVKAFDAEDGKLRLDVLHDSRSRRARPRHVAAGQRRVEVRRRVRLADAGRRSRARPHLFLDGQSRPRSATAACAPATTCSASRSSRSRRSTGKYRWHFQQVHHDIWDYDSPNPVVLFDARVRRRQCAKASSQVGKTGWAYILDRETGEPLIGIEERPVPQEPRQATAATQPYPLGDAIVPQSIDIPPEVERSSGCRAHQRRQASSRRSGPSRCIVKPGIDGGANWPPSSYDPETHLLYVCATDRVSATSSAATRAVVIRSRRTAATWAAASRSARRRDAASSRRSTSRRTSSRGGSSGPRSCYSGSVVDGRRPGVRRPQRRPAHGARQANGDAALGVQTDAGMNTTVEHVRAQRQAVRRRARGRRRVRGRDARRQRLDVLARRHDEVVACATAAPGGGGGGPGGPAAGRRRRPPNRPVDVEHGRQLYSEACVACHGEGGDGGHGGGPTLVAGTAAETILAVSQGGRNTMPAFGRAYSEADHASDIASYVVDVLAK